MLMLLPRLCQKSHGKMSASYLMVPVQLFTSSPQVSYIHILSYMYCYLLF
jgi:hypothetical protein